MVLRWLSKYSFVIKCMNETVLRFSAAGAGSLKAAGVSLPEGCLLIRQ